MKIINVITIILATILICSSCSDKEENVLVKDKQTLVQFSSSIESRNILRINNDNAWNDGDAIGIFMKHGEVNLSQSSIVNDAENKIYITPTGDNFVPETSEQCIYYSDEDEVDFIAYYPYSESIKEFMYPIDLTNQEDQKKLDLLYSDNLKQVNKTSEAIPLSFAHQLVKLKLNITTASGIENLEGLQIAISGMKVKASFMLGNGNIVEDDNYAKKIMPKIQSNGVTATAEAIVLPQIANSQRSINFTSPTLGSFTWNIPQDDSFGKGKIYTYNITLNH